jgi:hypothetical protein
VVTMDGKGPAPNTRLFAQGPSATDPMLELVMARQRRSYCWIFCATFSRLLSDMVGHATSTEMLSAHSTSV